MHQSCWLQNHVDGCTLHGAVVKRIALVIMPSIFAEHNHEIILRSLSPSRPYRRTSYALEEGGCDSRRSRLICYTRRFNRDDPNTANDDDDDDHEDVSVSVPSTLPLSYNYYDKHPPQHHRLRWAQLHVGHSTSHHHHYYHFNFESLLNFIIRTFTPWHTLFASFTS